MIDWLWFFNSDYALLAAVLVGYACVAAVVWVSSGCGAGGGEADENRSTQET